MITDYRHTVERLKQRINELGSHVYRDSEPLDSWRLHPGELVGAESPQLDDSGWSEVASLEGVDAPSWLRATVGVPERFDGVPVALRLRMPGFRQALFGTESLVYVDGQLVHGVGPYHTEVELTERAQSGRDYLVAVHVFWRPRPGTGGLKLHRRVDEPYEGAAMEIVWIDRDAERLYWDAITAYETALTMPEDDLRRIQVLNALDRAFHEVDFREPLGEAFFASLPAARSVLNAALTHGASRSSVPRAVAVGQTHIDVAWLWPISVTRKKIGRTFSTMLRLMETYPEFTFMQNQPQVYEYCKEDYPELYEQVKQRIAEGRWEANGGMWLEPDCNVPSGESLVRQLLFGQRFFRREFGAPSDTLCVMDVFGLPGSLPQLLRGAGLKYLVTNKLSWSQYNRIPYDSFDWQGIDGSRVLAHFLTAPSPSGRTTSNAVLNPGVVKASWDNYQQKALNDDVLFTFGYGDGGGGPSKEMLETAGRLKDASGPVRLEMGTVSGFFRELEERWRDRQTPIWNGELYLEFHRGTYTTRGHSKRLNRKSEVLYHSAELFSAMAIGLVGRAYPREELHEGWKLILLNQMHDILPGTTIPQVDVESRADYRKVEEIGRGVLEGAIDTLASRASASGASLAVFNPVSWARSDIVRASLTGLSGEFHLAEQSGRTVPHQVLRREGDAAEVVLQTGDVPSCGYSTYRIGEGAGDQPASSVSVAEDVLENRFFRIELDEQGMLASVYDKRGDREVLGQGSRGNVLQVFEDKPLSFDAWDIDIHYQDKMWEVDDVESVRVVETGPVRGGIEIRRRLGRSSIVQRVFIYDALPRVDFETEVEWHEKHTLLKVAFPVDVRSAQATYEIQFGTVERPTHWNTSWDWARFEVCGHKWADLSEGDYGVSLLNDCKYGHDVKDDVLRLTLLRSPTAPDPQSDEGHHEFTYSLYPHSGDWRTGTVRQGYQLNYPLHAVQADGNQGGLPASFSLVETDRENVVVDTVKLAEDGDELIVRCYEAHGQRGNVTLHFGRPVTEAFECNLLEEDRRPLTPQGDRLALHVTPYQVRTVGVRLG